MQQLVSIFIEIEKYTFKAYNHLSRRDKQIELSDSQAGAINSGNLGFCSRIHPHPLAPHIVIMDPTTPSDWPPSDWPPSDLSSSSDDNKKNAPSMDSRPTAKELLGTCLI